MKEGGFLMETQTLIITLLSISITLLIISFLKKDRNKAIEKQIENFSITLMQEIYQLKKKIKVLEEEILIGQDDRFYTSNKNVYQNYDRDQILSLYEEGHSFEEIEEMTGLTLEKINELLNET